MSKASGRSAGDARKVGADAMALALTLVARLTVLGEDGRTATGVAGELEGSLIACQGVGTLGRRKPGQHLRLLARASLASGRCSSIDRAGASSSLGAINFLLEGLMSAGASAGLLIKPASSSRRVAECELAPVVENLGGQ